MKIGVISDTHGYFDPKIPALFDGVEHILHAGDIGSSSVIASLEALAPVTAVIGNNDFDLSYNETEVILLAGRKFFVHHIVNPASPQEMLRQRIEREQPDAVIFGHSHKPFGQQLGRTFYFNPGYAGKPRFNLGRSVAILHCEDSRIAPEFRPL
jgi:hypothetical protein